LCKKGGGKRNFGGTLKTATGRKKNRESTIFMNRTKRKNNKNNYTSVTKRKKRGS